MDFKKGSYWSKWDLHIHTPDTKLSNNYTAEPNEDVWEKFCTTVEESDVSAFGITDYFSADNYFTLIEKHKHFYPKSEKVFFPNVELRLDVSVNKSSEEVNIHVIFSNDPEVTRQKIDEFLYKLKTNITVSDAVVACKNLSSASDYKKATINHSQIRPVLKEVFGKNECYLLIAAANNAGLRPDNNSPRKLSLTDEIDKICDGFFGGEQNVKYYLDIERYETDEKAKPKPVLTGCDAHSFVECSEYLGKKVKKVNQSGKEEVIKNITWIKAELSFEGLKQIKFEPDHRIVIGETQPREPIRKIESIKFNFPTNAVIKRNTSSDEQDLCIKFLKHEIYFSPYFTAIIGGRGTGKSTIINILAEKLGVRTDFFQKANNAILVEGKYLNIESDSKDTIEVKGTEEIEFVSQGQVEKLAEADQLTKLVFQERIRQLDTSFEDLDKQYEEVTQTLEENIRLGFEYKKLSDTLKEKEKEKSNYQKIIDSVNDETYQKITKLISEINAKLSLVESSKKQYETLIQAIRTTISNYIPTADENEYERRIVEIVTVLKSLPEIEDGERVSIKLQQFEKTDLEVDKLKIELKDANKQLQDFFETKGTSQESIRDSKNASEKLSKVSQEIETTKIKIEALRTKVNENKDKTDKAKPLYLATERVISKSIDEINERLKVRNENVLEIKFSFQFNKEAYKNSLFEEFHKTFNDYNLPNTSYDNIKSLLYEIEPDENFLNLTYPEFTKRLNSVIDDKHYARTNKYVTVVLSIFGHQTNFGIYKMLIRKHLYDLQRYVKITGFYGQRELAASSFGQRCTAVIVTLLMTGVKPLIVDEPEAHLDNKLIADYLVELIKTKKLDRQIIFATHNSNFVINGDAELVHILEVPDGSVHTNVTSTTIENLRYREKLLKLEGGKEAFLNRENKYGIENLR
jgi:DNA repair protein SbcC/Rad50